MSSGYLLRSVSQASICQRYTRLADSTGTHLSSGMPRVLCIYQSGKRPLFTFLLEKKSTSLLLVARLSIRFLRFFYELSRSPPLSPLGLIVTGRACGGKIISI
jgi:hypothetical protein